MKINNMVPRYTKDAPHGFTNRIENVAVVGVKSPDIA